MTETGTSTGRDEGPEAADLRVPRWAPGTQILWRYRENGGERVHICRPVTVVRDTADVLAVWLPPGTQCGRPGLAGGPPGHQDPGAPRNAAPRRTSRDRWHGMGVLKLARPGEPWSVWLWWDPHWRFRN